MEDDAAVRAEQALTEWRLEHFSELGFGEADCVRLLSAGADYHDAKRMLESELAATHDQVVRILS